MGPPGLALGIRPIATRDDLLTTPAFPYTGPSYPTLVFPYPKTGHLGWVNNAAVFDKGGETVELLALQFWQYTNRR